MFQLRFYFALTVAVVLGGCDHDCFVVEITPRGNEFERRLTCWHVKPVTQDDETTTEIQPLSTEQLARLARLYDRRETPDDAKKHVFVGKFSGQTPGDVGGAGSYTHFPSAMGTLSVYVERFRGNDDLESALAKRRAAADQLVDLLVGWFQSEMGEEPNFDRLRRFLDKDLRRDIKNLGLYMWAGSLAADYKPDADAEFWVRAGQYLHERGYFSRADVPELARAAMTEDIDLVLTHLQRLAARKLGAAEGERRPPSLTFLDSPQRALDSWERYVRTTDYFKKLVSEREAEKTDGDSDPPTPKEVGGELLAEAVLFLNISFGPDSLEVKLHCSNPPFDTNGKWDSEQRVVNWSRKLSAQPSLPALCSAMWSNPDQDFQQQHFGKTVLTDGQLGQYVMWYCGLRDSEQQQWDKFLSELTPGEQLIPAIKSFRFAADPSPGADDADERREKLANAVRNLLIGGLSDEEGGRRKAEG